MERMIFFVEGLDSSISKSHRCDMLRFVGSQNLWQFEWGHLKYFCFLHHVLDLLILTLRAVVLKFRKL